MGVAVAKVKPKRAGKSAVLSRQTSVVARTKAAAKSPEILAAEAKSGVPWGERTELAKNCGKLVEAIFRFTKKNEIPRSLKRRLDNCASDLWDVEMEQDMKSGAYQCSEFGKMGERASRDSTEDNTLSLEEALEFMKKRRNGKVIPFKEALKLAKARR